MKWWAISARSQSLGAARGSGFNPNSSLVLGGREKLPASQTKNVQY